MPWEKTDVSEQRVKFVVRAVSGKERMTELCREFGISRPTGYRWRRRFEQSYSVTGVLERSRRPAHSPWRTELNKEERVGVLRQQYGWGAKKIEVLLREEGTQLTVTTINRILKRRGWVRKNDSIAPALGRFERSTPNELWQMDGKGKYRSKDGTCYPLSILDDHSRYAVGLYGLTAFTAEQVYPCLVRTFERYGVPEAMLMDHGTVWWGTSNGYGLTWLSVRLIEQGIGLYYGRVHHPQTQGKVERFHRTLEEAMRHRGKPKWMAEWPGALVGSAATDISGHGGVNVLVRRIFLGLQERGGLHHLSGLAVAALRHVDLHPGLLDRMQSIGAQAFHCGDFHAVHSGHRRDTGAHGQAVFVNRASAAQRHPAAKLRARQSKFITRNLRGVRGSQPFQSLETQRHKLSVHFHLRGVPRRKHQIAYLFAALQHGGNKLRDRYVGRCGWRLRSGCHGVPCESSPIKSTGPGGRLGKDVAGHVPK